jgi:hypothetical protein
MTGSQFRAAVIAYLQGWLKAYPEDVFVPPPPPDPNDEEDAVKRSVYSAHMARHVLRGAIDDIANNRGRFRALCEDQEAEMGWRQRALAAERELKELRAQLVADVPEASSSDEPPGDVRDATYESRLFDVVDVCRRDLAQLGLTLTSIGVHDNGRLVEPAMRMHADGVTISEGTDYEQVSIRLKGVVIRNFVVEGDESRKRQQRVPNSSLKCAVGFTVLAAFLSWERQPFMKTRRACFGPCLFGIRRKVRSSRAGREGGGLCWTSWTTQNLEPRFWVTTSRRPTSTPQVG